MLTFDNLQSELSVACPGITCSCGDFGDKTTWKLYFPDSATDTQKQAAQAVIDAADPATIFNAPRVWTPFQFFQKFTPAETSAILNSTYTTVKTFVLSMQLYQVVYPDDPSCKAGLDYLVSIGILTADRETAILQ